MARKVASWRSPRLDEALGGSRRGRWSAFAAADAVPDAVPGDAGTSAARVSGRSRWAGLARRG
ncbi:MAG: hypothetical protein HOV94_09305 [Saccharothrix sp.]|nr:hypothetical protein [Saccharothrix sp.]